VLDVINTLKCWPASAKHERFKARLERSARIRPVQPGAWPRPAARLRAERCLERQGQGRLNAAEKEGLMVLQAGPDVVRFAPSLVVEDATSTKASLRTRRGHTDPRLIAIRAGPSVGRLIRPGLPPIPEARAAWAQVALP
jgi:acetylornithine/N-succinyldiaminopimelate aminotransferase